MCVLTAECVCVYVRSLEAISTLQEELCVQTIRQHNGGLSHEREFT